MRHLVAQNAAAHRHDPVVVAVLALAGDDQNQPLPIIMGIEDEARQGWMGLRQGHAVQVDAPLGLELAARHLAKGGVIHPDRRMGDALRKILCGLGRMRLVPGAFPDAKGGQAVAGLDWVWDARL
jgi:hypothetical protein